MHPEPLPASLRGIPFTVAEAYASGLSPARLRSRDLDASVWGVRGSIRDPSRLAKAVLFSKRLPDDAVFSHTTAAQLLGIPVPWRATKETRLHVSVPAPRRAPHANGVIGHQSERAEDEVVIVGGVRVSSTIRTWVDLASMVSLTDLVAAGDYIIHWRLPLATRHELAASIRRRSSTRGVRLLRQAIDLLDDRSESPPESELRVILALAGLPSPEINHALVDTETGTYVRPDFIFRDERVILEYQGDYHRTKTQWRKDMTRRSRLEAQHWYVMELNADDLRDPTELVARIRSVLARRR